MRLKPFLFILLALIVKNTFAQQITDKPKLVVVMVVDQMRADYISRYWGYFRPGGFKKLATEGYSLQNANYNFFPTYTAAGHSCISTGSVPAINGIVGNDWFDRFKLRSFYCTTDTSVKSIGTHSPAGKMSPVNLLTTTLGDELRLASNYRSKVIGIALKDRAAILTAGHNASGVYWFDESNGRFISSSYYTNRLPAWLDNFNNKKLVDRYLSESWNTSRPIGDYKNTSTPDNNLYEGTFTGEKAPVFPHDVPSLKAHYNYGLIRTLPNGNKLTFDLAKAAIESESLGRNEGSDLLNVSFSSPDYIGHQFGPRSIEVADMYIKFDLELENFISYLDKHVGKGKYLICLTADHGASDNPIYLKDHDLPGGHVAPGLKDTLNAYLKARYNIAPVIAFQNLQFYFNKSMIKERKLSESEIMEAARMYFEKKEFVKAVYTKEEILQSGQDKHVLSYLKNGYYQRRCGDLTLVLNSGWIESNGRLTGTTHGSTYVYDTHVPLIFFGWNIKAGTDDTPVFITDIAPTLASFLNISPPSGNVGQVIKRLLK